MDKCQSPIMLCPSAEKIDAEGKQAEPEYDLVEVETRPTDTLSEPDAEPHDLSEPEEETITQCSQHRFGGAKAKLVFWGVIVALLGVSLHPMMDAKLNAPPDDPASANDIGWKMQQPIALAASLETNLNMTLAPDSSVLSVPANMPVENLPQPLALNDKRITLPLTRQAVSISNVGGVIHYKSAYYGTVTVAGNPYRVVFDTGSGHLILPTTYCHDAACRMHRRYSRRQSTTAVDIDFDGATVNANDPRDAITVGFGTGEVTGVFIEDLICVDNSTLSAWTPEERDVKYDISTKLVKAESHMGCVRMRFLAATKMSEDPFSTFEFDGVLGLAMKGTSQTPEFNVAHVFRSHLDTWNSDTPPIFSVFLANSGAEGSEITFGGYDEKHLAEKKVYWEPVLDPENGHWLVRIKQLRVGDDIMQFCEDGECKGVVDTGTSLLGVPSEAFPELYRNLWHPTALDGSCLGVGPKLTVELESGYTIQLGPEDFTTPQKYSASQNEMNKELPFPWGVPWSGGEEEVFGSTRYDLQCKPLLMSLNLEAPLGPKLLILGEPVLRKYYTIFDTEQQRVGFGFAAHAPEQKKIEEVKDDIDDWFFDTGDDEA